MKEVSKKDNELDKLTSTLEKKEKKIKETDTAIYVAKEEIQNLNRSIADKETQLKINEQNFGPKAAALVKEAAKADEAEKLRKDLEHATNFTEEQIEKLEADLRLSKKTMRETHEKYDETGKRIAVKERKFEMAKESAEQKEKREKELEQALADLARKMANMESSREKIGKKEEHNKNQLKKLSLMLKEAEHRAELKEEEQQKMELVISQMNEEQEIYKKMRQQKHAALSSKT